MKTSIVVLAYNKLAYTQGCIESIRTYTRKGSYEIIVVDNNSTDGTADWLAQQDDLKVISNTENRGFPAGCNQGMEVASGDNVLLLNNDTIVTHNWLDNLLSCLYSADDIGAVGAVTNFANYYQTVRCNYQSTEEMHRFARDNNISSPDRWEQRIKLIGFCMLIRKSVIDQIGLLDERFSPGHFEDDDYSVRIRRAGYRLILCRDVFVHHHGSISFRENSDVHVALGARNAGLFEDKWGFNSEYSSYIRDEIIECIDKSKNDHFRVLEIGCACGATLLKIRHIYKNAELYGVDMNAEAVKDAQLFASARAGDIEKDELNYPEGYFDYIIFADVLEHLIDPWNVLSRVGRVLAPAGRILASIPNIMHYSVIRDLVNGFWTYREAGLLDRTHLRFFTLHEIVGMFNGTGYPYVCSKPRQPAVKKAEDIEFIRKLGELGGQDKIQQYLTNQYILMAGKNRP